MGKRGLKQRVKYALPIVNTVYHVPICSQCRPSRDLGSSGFSLIDVAYDDMMHGNGNIDTGFTWHSIVPKRLKAAFHKTFEKSPKTLRLSVENALSFFPGNLVQDL